jgi:hypothetical protein
LRKRTVVHHKSNHALKRLVRFTGTVAPLAAVLLPLRAVQKNSATSLRSVVQLMLYNSAHFVVGVLLAPCRHLQAT